MNYDLSADATDVRALLREAVETYLRSRADALEDHPPVTRVELAMLPGDVTTLYVDFDVRPEPEADGDAQFSCIAELPRPGWRRLFSPPEGENLALVFPDGSTHTPPDGEGTYGYGVDDTLARFLAACLNQAHADGAFDRISERPGPRLTLTFDGNDVWEGPGGV